jgi:hypothetical protein
VGVQDHYIIGNAEFVDLIEPDDSSAQRSIKGPSVAGHDALPPSHAHAEDVHELGVIAEE